MAAKSTRCISRPRTCGNVSYLGHIDRTNTERLVCDFTNIERERVKPVVAAAAGRVQGGGREESEIRCG